MQYRHNALVTSRKNASAVVLGKSTQCNPWTLVNFLKIVIAHVFYVKVARLKIPYLKKNGLLN